MHLEPTLQAKGVAINDDQRLESEADVMGQKAVQAVHTVSAMDAVASDLASHTLQRKSVIQMVAGSVKMFDNTKGYGFITPDSGGKDIFVSINAIQAAGLRGLNEGQKVSFSIVQGSKGAEAEGLHLV